MMAIQTGLGSLATLFKQVVSRSSDGFNEWGTLQHWDPADPRISDARRHSLKNFCLERIIMSRFSRWSSGNFIYTNVPCAEYLCTFGSNLVVNVGKSSGFMEHMG